MTPAAIVTTLISTNRPKLLRGVAMIEDAAERLGIKDARKLVDTLCHKPGKLDKKREYSKQQRRQVWDRDGGTCYHCKKQIPFNKHCHADHVIPWSLGGKTTINNAVCSCGSCNVKRGNKLVFVVTD